MKLMMSCKQVSTLISTGELSSSPLHRRLAARLHLAMCDHCTAFKRWLDLVGDAARAADRAAEREAPRDLEARALRRIERSNR